MPEVHQRFRDFAQVMDPGQRLSRTVKDLEEKLQRCESPIEQILLIEITRLLTEWELTRFCTIDPQIWAYYTEDIVRDDAPPLLGRLGFAERIRGSHHIFTKEGVEEILNLQPKGRQAKPYQVKQVLGGALDVS